MIDEKNIPFWLKKIGIRALICNVGSYSRMAQLSYMKGDFEKETHYDNLRDVFSNEIMERFEFLYKKLSKTYDTDKEEHEHLGK